LFFYDARKIPKVQGVCFFRPKIQKGNFTQNSKKRKMEQKNIEVLVAKCYDRFKLNIGRGDEMHNEVLEDLVVVKRSGQRVNFNASKVAIAIKKAFDGVGFADDKKVFKIFEKVLNFINENYKDRKTINVEDIQDIIENTLYNEKVYNVYNAFKEYRQKRALSRKVFAEKQQHKFVKAIEKIEESTLNKDNSKCADDLIFDFGKIISSEYTKSYILDTKSVRAAEEGNIYIHDLDYFTLGMFPNLHLKLKRKLTDDYDVDILINDIVNAEREVYGEIGLNNFDDLIEPFILRRFKKSFVQNLYKYLKLLGFLELINFKKLEEQISLEKTVAINIENYQQILVNAQLKNVFETAKTDAWDYINKVCDNVILKILLSLENRAERNTTYTLSFGLNSSEIGKMVNTRIFTILSKNTYKKINLIVKINILNMDIFNKIAKLFDSNNSVCIHFVGNEKAIDYFVDGVKIYDNTNDVSPLSNGRMVVSSSSINLARLGLKFQNKSKEEFYEELSNIVELVKNELLLSFETIGSKYKEYYRALFHGNVYEDEKLENGQKIRKVIKNGCLNIGVIGLKECVTCLEKNENKRKKLLNEIIEFLREKCQVYTTDTKLNFGLYEPISCHARTKLLAIDKAIYGLVPDVTDKKRYDLLDVDIMGDYAELAKIQKSFSSGKLIIINLPGKINIKKIADTLENLKANNVEFAKMVVGKNEY